METSIGNDSAYQANNNVSNCDPLNSYNERKLPIIPSHSFTPPPMTISPTPNSPMSISKMQSQKKTESLHGDSPPNDCVTCTNFDEKAAQPAEKPINGATLLRRKSSSFIRRNFIRPRAQSLAVAEESQTIKKNGLLHKLYERDTAEKSDEDDDRRPSLEETRSRIPSEVRSPRRMSLAEGLRSLRPDFETKRRQSMRRKTKKSRLVSKDGDCNVYCTNVPKMGRNYLRDIFTTLIDSKWRWILGGLSLIFSVSWIFFATLYFLICFFHGDFVKYSKDRGISKFAISSITNSSRDSADNPPCIEKVFSFTSAFLFSVETQHTIGYGYRDCAVLHQVLRFPRTSRWSHDSTIIPAMRTLGVERDCYLGSTVSSYVMGLPFIRAQLFVTTTCAPAILAVCLQSLVGLLIQSLMVGLVFAKISRPKKRAATLVFSQNAVVTLQDGHLCFLVRVADMRNTHLVEAHVRMQLIKQRVTEEGEVEPLHQFEMDIGCDSGADRIFLVWPITICHVITKDSPLYDLNAKDLPTAQFEVIVLLEGIVESTGMTAQARTSYLPSEVLWGHRFEKLMTYQKCNGSYKVDFGLFHSAYKVNTPKWSAVELDKMKKSGLQKKVSHVFFHKNDVEARLEASNGEEGHTPVPSQLSTPNFTPPITIKEDKEPTNLLSPRHHSTIGSSPFHSFLMANFDSGNRSFRRKSEHQQGEKPKSLDLLRPPGLFHTGRRRQRDSCGDKTGNNDSTSNLLQYPQPPQIVINSPVTTGGTDKDVFGYSNSAISTPSSTCSYVPLFHSKDSEVVYSHNMQDHDENQTNNRDTRLLPDLAELSMNFPNHNSTTMQTALVNNTVGIEAPDYDNNSSQRPPNQTNQSGDDNADYSEENSDSTFRDVSDTFSSIGSSNAGVWVPNNAGLSLTENECNNDDIL